MKACPDHREILYMDVYGELDSAGRSRLQKHLAACEGCCRERDRLVRMLETVKDAMPRPELAEEKAEAMIRSITRQLREQVHGPWWVKWGLFKPVRLVPTLVAACLLIVAVSWFSPGGKYNTTSKQTASTAGLEEQYVEDLDVINNLELLEEMETIQKLVQVVDTDEIGRLMEWGSKENRKRFPVNHARV